MVGGPEATAAAETAPQYKQVDFVLVGGRHPGANVTSVVAGDGLRADVAEAAERTTDASH